MSDEQRPSSAKKPKAKKNRGPRLKIPIQQPNKEQTRTDGWIPNVQAPLIFPDGTQEMVNARDLVDLQHIGQGTFGIVTRSCLRTHPDYIFAVKHITFQDDNNEQKTMMKDLEVNKSTIECPYTVSYLGALFKEGEILICMELCDMSLDNYYKKAHQYELSVPDFVLASVAHAVLKAIQFLHDKKMMHRDIKPSNILIKKQDNGTVSILVCDFGIAGNLVNSMAKTNVGCKPYMSPERIKAGEGYTYKSDIWSLGVSLIELAEGKHPFTNASTQFDILKMVMEDPAPGLDQDDRFPESCADFISLCLKKDPIDRAHYELLLEHRFLQECMNPQQLFDHYEELQRCIKSEENSNQQS